MKSFSIIKEKILLFLILAIAISFRLFGLNWDQNQHLHPDERFLTIVAPTIKIPKNILNYLNPTVSTANPYNSGFDFYVYGTFPLYLVKIIGEIFKKTDYDQIHLVGRAVSAFFDVGVVFLVFKIGKKIYGIKEGLLAAFFYSIMVLPIQLSHFWAVDTFLNFFIVFSFYFLILFITNYNLPTIIFLGTSFGLALACKVSALYFLPIIGLAFIYTLFTHKNKTKSFLFGLIFGLCVYLVFRLCHPSAFSSVNFLDLRLNSQLLANIKQLQFFNNPEFWYPPSVQWIKTQPLVFPLKNLVLWGMGLPIGIVSVSAVGFTIVSLFQSFRVKRKIKQLQLTRLLIIAWIAGLFLYQGTQFAKTMRYFLPLYPFLAIVSANFLREIYKLSKTKLSPKFLLITKYLLLVTLIIYPLSFISIYTKPITRVQASYWIYENIPPGSIIANEHWDDPLPLSFPETISSHYRIETLALYDPDTPEKWEKITSQLDKADYIILSSNRLYGSIPQNPEKYPQASRYYEALFNGSLGFEKVAEFTSYPCFPPFTKKYLLCLRDDSAEEAFTVYDHPKVMILKKNRFY